MLESARELTIEAATSASARLMDDSTPRPKDISAMLNGRTEREKLSGMRQVISVSTKKSLEIISIIKKMVGLIDLVNGKGP
jgi:hypothetical protein